MKTHRFGFLFRRTDSPTPGELLGALLLVAWWSVVLGFGIGAAVFR